MTKERGGTTAEAKDKENRAYEEKEGQWKLKIQRVELKKRKKYRGNQRQREVTKETGKKTANTKY